MLIRRVRRRLSRTSNRAAVKESSLRVERLEERCVLTTLTVGANVNVSQPSLNGSQNETTIAINPTNPNNLFVAANGPFPNFARYSMDGGITWSASDWGDMPTACCDNQATFDKFGNLFLTYLSSSAVRVVLSTNGGQSFSLVGTFSGGVDQPSIAAGGGGSFAPASVWVSWNEDGTMRASGAPITGLGSIGAWNSASGQVATDGSFGGTAVGKNGEVMLTYQNPYNANGPSTIYAIADADGLGPNGFSAAVEVTQTNVGGWSPIPAQPQRTIDTETNLAWDYTKSNRVYLVYVNRPDTSSADTDVYVRHSDDLGNTWTPPARVNDDGPTGKSQFNPAIAVDQSTGFIAVTWYDCRNSPNNDTAQIYGSVSTRRGRDWVPNVKIAQGLSNGPLAGSFNFGDYDTMAYAGGRFYRTWADNTNPSQLTPANNGTTSQDVATARVDVVFSGGREFFDSGFVDEVLSAIRISSWPTKGSSSGGSQALGIRSYKSEVPEGTQSPLREATVSHSVTRASRVPGLISSHDSLAEVLAVSSTESDLQI